MQNWRHAGRFGVNFLPYANDGTTNTAGDLDIGSAGAPWKDLYLATGSSIYVGGTAFEGGGGGSAVEVFEQKSHLEKVGYDYPLSNPQSQNESFMDSSAMILTLGKTHLNTETTIYLDRDAISISAIDAASATAWTPINTGTTATNTTAGQNVDGTSIKHSVTMTNTSYFMAHSFTSFSLTDRDVKVWLWPDVLANVTAALIRLECATTTVYCEFQVPVASIATATLNSLYLNMDSPDTTTANFNRSAITRVYLGAKGTATPQAIEWSWDKLRSVDNRKLKVPVQMVADNGTNQEFINITTATVAGDIYTLETISTYTHTISSSEIRLKQLDISNGQGVIGSGTTGDAALTGWDIQRTYMNTSTTGDLIITSRWYDESYPVATITNASTTVLSVTTSTVAAGFKSGDVVRLYKWEYVDQNYQSPVNASIGSNFLDLTLTADGTATSSQLTLVHANTSNQNLGGDTADKWRGVRVSADDYYRVEAATASQALIKAMPSQFLLSKVDKQLFFEDTFNRTDGATVGNDWGEGNDGSGASPTILNNQLKINATAAGTSFVYRNAEAYVIASLNRTMYIKIKVTPTNAGDNTAIGYFYFTFGSANTALSTSGIYVQVEETSAGVWRLVITEAGGSTNVAITVTEGVQYDLDLQITRKTIKARFYQTGATIPAWQLSYTKSSNLTLGGTYSQLGCRSSSGIMTTYVNNVEMYYGDEQGYINKSTISSVSGNKLITATRLTRQDATNQNPIVYQRNAVII